MGKYKHDKDVCLKNLGSGMLGKKQTDYQKTRMSEIHKEKIISEEQRKQISNTHKRNGIMPKIEYWFKKGQRAWNKNTEMSLIQRKKISATKRGITIEEVGNLVKVKKYSIEFYKKRDFIKLRDKYTCQECITQSSNLDVHHIDYNKSNNNLDNLITLCYSCHSKTNANRPIWLNKFKEVLQNSNE